MTNFFSVGVFRDIFTYFAKRKNIENHKNKSREKFFSKMNDTITVSLASIPSRAKCLKEMFYSIIEQVDTFQIYLNSFHDDQIPSYLLNNPKVKLYRSQEERFGDRGDAGKFYHVQNIQGWHLVCDDDLHYPYNYAERMIEKCEEYHRKVIVGCHGGDFSQFPLSDSYACRINKSHYQKTSVQKDYFVHFLATNSICFHTETISLHENDFQTANMADMWLALKCQLTKTGMLCLQKNANWIRDCMDVDPFNSIFFNQYNPNKRGNAFEQTKIVNSLSRPWKHYRVDGKKQS